MIANAGAQRMSLVTAPGGVPVVAAVGAPTTPEPPAKHDATTPRPFAELLRQSRAERPPPCPPAPPAPAPSASQSDPKADADPTDAEASAPTSQAPPPTPAKSRVPAPKNATGKAPVESARATSETAGDERDERVRAQSDGGASIGSTSPDRAALLATMAPADVARGARDSEDNADRASDAAAACSGVEDDAARSAHGTGARRAIQAQRDAAIDAGASRASLAEASGAQAATAAGEPMFRIAWAEASHAGEAPASASRRDGAIDAATASIAAAAAASNGAEPLRAASGTSELVLTTPIDAPEFAAALGLQVSLLARDGVQHAELHLNPAETGPLSIHIALDGNAARVDFGADLAATRHAIEQGLPELASALRDAGLTLTGGGVSQHAGRRDADEDDAAARPGRTVEARAPSVAATAALARIARRTAAGGVDLYA